MTTCTECDRPSKARGLCQRHYMRLRRTGQTGVRISREPEVKAQWIEGVLQTTSHDCIDWPWGQHPGGYGTTRRQGRGFLVHAYICERAHGVKPHPTWHAAHECGRPICCNPHHLAWKSPADNIADKIRHGTIPKGQDCASSRLTDDEVIEIRLAYASGSQRQAALAHQFGVTQPTISDIVTRKAWTHL